MPHEPVGVSPPPSGPRIMSHWMRTIGSTAICEDKTPESVDQTSVKSVYGSELAPIDWNFTACDPPVPGRTTVFCTVTFAKGRSASYCDQLFCPIRLPTLYCGASK